MNYNGWYAKKIDLINKGLTDYLNIAYPKSICEAMRYSIFPGGKRIRPVILLAVCEALGGSDESALPFACALEMIHTYSLIHDDLPAMDNDDMRRGRPTNHIVYGEATAILAGDALLNLAYEIMAEHCMQNNVSHFLKAMSKIAKNAGIKGMIGGQVMDIALENTAATAAQIEYVYEYKTSKLFTAAFGSGALIANANCTDVLLLENIGHDLGIAFQLKDDLLDLYGDDEFGKPLGSDEKNKKSTYITVFGEEQTIATYNRLCSSFILKLKQLQNSEFLVVLAENLVDRTR